MELYMQRFRLNIFLGVAILSILPFRLISQEKRVTSLNHFISGCPAGWFGIAKYQDSLDSDQSFIANQVDGIPAIIIQLIHEKYVNLDTAYGRLRIGNFKVVQQLDVFLFEKSFSEQIKQYYSKADSVLSYYPFETKSFVGIIGPFMDLGEKIYPEMDELLCHLQTYFREEFEEF